jgi:hypothetical protein
MGVAGTATAADHGFYMGVDAGVASYPNDVRVFLNGTDYERESSKGTDFAWSFAAGYRFNRYLALEAGFSDLGHAETDLVTSADPDTSRGDVKQSARGKTLALLTHIPIGNWDSYFKAGAIHSIFGTKVRAKVDGNEFQSSWQNEGTQLLLGVGTRYAFTEQWAVSFALDYYVKVGGPGQANIASPRIGFAYRF